MLQGNVCRPCRSQRYGRGACEAHSATGGRRGDGGAPCARMADTTPWVSGVLLFPTRRMIMDEIAFHREPPSNIPTLVTAFSGWIDAGEAATGAMRFLVRQLAAAPLAAIDPEDFVDFTQVRPVVRLSAEGRADHPLAAECVLALAAARAPGRAAAVSGPGAPAAVAHLRHGAPGRRRALWGAADRVAGRDARGPAPYPAPTRHGQQHRPPLARAVRGVGDGASLALRRPDRHCQRDVGRGARRGMASLTVMGKHPTISRGRRIRQ